VPLRREGLYHIYAAILGIAQNSPVYTDLFQCRLFDHVFRLGGLLGCGDVHTDVVHIISVFVSHALINNAERVWFGLVRFGFSLVRV
jgi:hypothetical protein